jgi:hypothetical protein
LTDLPDFAELRKLFSAYKSRVRYEAWKAYLAEPGRSQTSVKMRKHPEHAELSSEGYHLFEAEKRLRQIDWLLKRVSKLEHRFYTIHKARDHSRSQPLPKTSSRLLISSRPSRHGPEVAVLEEIELLAESFYYIAFRLRGAVRRLHGFATFDAKGVREVRNHLIEHPEKAGTIFWEEEISKQPDEALFPLFWAHRRALFDLKRLAENAREFHDNLMGALRRNAAAAE